MPVRQTAAPPTVGALSRRQLLKRLQQRTLFAERTSIADEGRQMWAAFDARHYLIERADGGRELYDLQRDFAQKRERIAADPEAARRLAALLRDHRERDARPPG